MQYYASFPVRTIRIFTFSQHYMKLPK